MGRKKKYYALAALGIVVAIIIHILRKVFL